MLLVMASQSIDLRHDGRSCHHFFPALARTLWRKITPFKVRRSHPSFGKNYRFMTFLSFPLLKFATTPWENNKPVRRFHRANPARPNSVPQDISRHLALFISYRSLGNSCHASAPDSTGSWHAANSTSARSFRIN
jgi:hypothetical protein